MNSCLVPTTPTTVIASRTMPRPGLPLDVCTRHAADVADVQLVLVHAWSDESSSDAVGVKQYTPKLSPDIVTLPVPVRTALGGSEKLAAGAAREGIRHNMQAGTRLTCDLALKRFRESGPICLRTIECELLRPCSDHRADCHSFPRRPRP